MRRPRLKVPSHFPVAFYHCISRVVDRRFLFSDLDKDRFVSLLRECERFCRVRVLSFTILSPKATIRSGSERMIRHTGTETRPRLLREAAVGNFGQWGQP